MERVYYFQNILNRFFISIQLGVMQNLADYGSELTGWRRGDFAGPEIRYFLISKLRSLSVNPRFELNRCNSLLAFIGESEGGGGGKRGTCKRGTCPHPVNKFDPLYLLCLVVCKWFCPNYFNPPPPPHGRK